MNSIKNHNTKGMTARMMLLIGVGVGAVITAVVGVARATPSSGIVSAAVLARASFVEPVDVKFKVEGKGQEVVHVSESQDTVIQQIIIGPGGSTGWHSHPGPAVALITAGVLSLYSSDDPSCTPRHYSAGEAFVDRGQGHVHLARNLSPDENVVVWVTYFDVPPGGSPRLDAADPGNCGF
jgi:quercetin dioxygenase-like cupin family protein